MKRENRKCLGFLGKIFTVSSVPALDERIEKMENLCVLCGEPNGDKMFCKECDAPEHVLRWSEANTEEGEL